MRNREKYRSKELFVHSSNIPALSSEREITSNLSHGRHLIHELSLSHTHTHTHIHKTELLPATSRYTVLSPEDFSLLLSVHIGSSVL